MTSLEQASCLEEAGRLGGDRRPFAGNAVISSDEAFELAERSRRRATSALTAAASEAVESGPVVLRLHPRRMLLPLEFFGVLYGVKLSDAFALVEDCRLWPAFNLARSGESRRKIHLWRGCVERYEAGRSVRKKGLANIIAAILPGLGLAEAGTAKVRGSELSFRFCCSNHRITGLLHAGELREVGRHNPFSQTPRISYASAARFLESRLL